MTRKNSFPLFAVIVAIFIALSFWFWSYYVQKNHLKRVADLLKPLDLPIAQQQSIDNENKILRLKHPDQQTLELLK
jgi:type VI protein secretion system component VasK